MKMFTIAIFSVLLLSNSVHAEIKGCYETKYSKAYLAQHKGQVITRLQLQYGFEDDANAGENEDNTLNAKFPGAIQEGLYLGFICTSKQPPLGCMIVNNKGFLKLTETSIGLILESETAIEKVSWDGDGTEKKIPAGPGNSKYVLKKISKKTCD